MKILALSDQVEPRIYSPLILQSFRDVDLIVGCGDLPYEYLEYVLTLLNVPLVYVPGNHDPAYNPRNPQSYAEGGINLDRKLANIKGLWLAGLGGSIRYKPEGENQYTQFQMYERALPLAAALWRHRLLGRRLDVLITHSPPAGVHDDDDPTHRGLQAINWLIRRFRPRFLLHGHTMFYKQNLIPNETSYLGTRVINVYPYRLIEIPEEDHA
jgi:hypothetical protein